MGNITKTEWQPYPPNGGRNNIGQMARKVWQAELHRPDGTDRAAAFTTYARWHRPGGGDNVIGQMARTEWQP